MDTRSSKVDARVFKPARNVTTRRRLCSMSSCLRLIAPGKGALWPSSSALAGAGQRVAAAHVVYARRAQAQEQAAYEQAGAL